MAKKKEFFIEEDERFVIPQINHSTSGLIRKKEGFKKSKVVSPFHGTNVLDNKSYIDNSGSVDVNYGYDFVRENKKVSDEELIKRHGTKYYEFNFLNKKDNQDLYGGSDYSNKKKSVITEEKPKKSFGFIHGLDELEDEEIVVVEKTEVKPHKNDENYEFKLNLSIDEDDTYEYKSYKEEKKTSIPSFLSNKPNNNIEEEIVINSPKDNYSNPAVNKNQSISDAIKNMTPFNPADIKQPEVKPVFNEKAVEEVNVSTGPDYSNYYIPYEEFLNMNLAVSDDNPSWLQEKKEIINDSLASFNIEGEVVTYTKGPAFTRYEIMLGQGVNVKKINQIYENLQKDLQATSIRILAPIPGKNTVGIEVPNNVAEVVPFSSIINGVRCGTS